VTLALRASVECEVGTFPVREAGATAPNGAACGVIGFPCHAHDNDNDIKWGSYTPHMCIYTAQRIAAMTQGLSKPGPGDRNLWEIRLWLSPPQEFFSKKFGSKSACA
jgi:hypothetical protein